MKGKAEVSSNPLIVLNPKQAAVFLNCSTDTVYSMTHLPNGEDGSLPHFHFGKAIRYYQPALELWIINNLKGFQNRELIDLKKKLVDTIGNRKEIEPSQQGVSHV